MRPVVLRFGSCTLIGTAWNKNLEKPSFWMLALVLIDR